MKKVKLVLGGKEVLVIGTSQTIRQVAADRLGCANDRVVFKIEDNGELCEFADTRPAWEHLARENTTIHAFVGAGATLKRKAAAENEEQGFESDASSFKTPPRDTHRNASSSRNAARENGTSVAVRSESSRAGTSSGKSVSSRKRWTTKDDQLLWRKLNLILDAMQRPDPVYTADDSDKVFKTLQRHGVFSARSVHALKSRVQRKASLAQRRGQPCPARVKALFPLMTYRSSRDGTRQSAQLIGGNETSDSTDSSEEEMDEDREEAEVSTASEPTPPPQAARHPTGEKERPVIRDYNPFAPYAAVRPPSWTTSSRSAAANDVQASSSAKTLVAQQKSMAGSLPASNSSLVPERPTLSVSHRSPDESTILEGTRIGTNSGGASREAIVIKDESDEEQTQQALVSNDSSSVEIKREPVTLSFAAERPAVRRAVAAHTRELFPLQRIDVLPPVKWAVELAKWIKDGVLESIWEEEKRTEILMICFDEFFQSAYTRINVEYSVRRASFAIMLLFLDLYQALLDVEQVQVALTELFHRRIFTADGGRGTLGAADWLAMDFCAAGTLLIPTRPSWLLGEIFQRANHLATEQVPPPLERATFLFSLLKQLFAKLEQSRKFVRSNGELLLLTKSIHTSLVGQKTRANLAALFRQCRARLPATEEYETLLASIEEHNSKAQTEDLDRREEEDAYFSARILLLCAPHPFAKHTVESLIARYSLPIQTASGPMKKKFTSTHETMHLWILQVDSASSKQAALNALRSYPPTGDLQFLSGWQQNHSWSRSVQCREEQRRWNRSCCDIHLHREHHRHAVSRLKQEAQKEPQGQLKQEPL